jgi:hypothetical protein
MLPGSPRAHRPNVASAALLAGLVGVAALAAFPGDARAQSAASSSAGSPSSVDGGSRPAPHRYRNGAVLGAVGGIAFAGASGYPNDVKLLNNPDFYSQSPLLVGYSTSLFVLGALSDYVNFGPVFTTANFESAAWKSTGFGLGFRGEFFPFVDLFPALANTAAFAQLGFGRTELRAKGNYPSADGSQSMLGLGVHHELRLGTLLGGHAALGPELEWNLIDAKTASRNWLTAGLRVVWYGGKVELDGGSTRTATRLTPRGP